MVDFKIRRGLSTTMFKEPGVINPRLLIEEGCWYLCTDTAELFLGVKVETDSEEEFTLKKINGVATPSVNPDEPNEDVNNLKFLVEDLDERVKAIEDIELFQKIAKEEDLPTNFDSEDFDPNVTYYIQSENNQISTFIYDNDLQGYVCTNAVNIDEDTLRSMVITIIRETVTDTVEETLDTKVTEAVSHAFENITLIYGGDATPEN
jgi:hypothetical protein